MPEPPDRDAITALLTLIESSAHRSGWDQRPALLLLYDTRDADSDRHYRGVPAHWGRTVRLRQYAAIPCVPPIAMDGSHALFRLANNLQRTEQPAVQHYLGHMRRPGFVGMAFCCEGWGRVLGDGDAPVPGRRFADTPGSVETRILTAADTAGVDYHLVRIRGEKPTTLTDPEGSVVECLRAVVAAIAGLPVPRITTIPAGWDWSEQTYLEAKP